MEHQKNEQQQAAEVCQELVKRGLVTVKDGLIIPATSKKADYTLQSAATTKEKEAEWVVPGYIPRGCITVIAGEGGVGKTSLWCSLVSAITTGRHSFLLGNTVPEEFKADPENVLALTSEDSWAHTLVRRLNNNGADLTKVWYIDPGNEHFTELDFTSDYLKGLVEANRPSVIIFDPVQAFVPLNMKMSDRNAMRKCFSALMAFGEEYGTTCIVIVHANKQSGVWGRKRIADSADIWDASRSILMTGVTPDGKTRYISQEKSNYGPLQNTVLFELENTVPVFRGYTEKKDRDFVLAESKERAIRPALETAKDFIIGTLEEHKQMEVKELEELAQTVGVSKSTLKRAKAELNREGRIHTWSNGFGQGKAFLISLLSEQE